MKKLICLLLGIALLGITSGLAMAVENTGTDGVETVSDVVELPQNVQNQLDIALMALELANSDTTITTEGTDVEGDTDAVDPVKMEALAERHAFIAWAHYNHVPASRKLQEQVFNKTVEVETLVAVETDVQKINELGEPVFDEAGNPVYETTEELSLTTMSLWDKVKGELKVGELGYTGILEGINASVPEAEGLINGDVNWGQYKKTSQMTTLQAQATLKASKGKALGKDKEKGDHGNKGGNKDGGHGNNGGGNGKNK